MRSAPTPASTSQDCWTPWFSSESGTKVRTTATPVEPATGSRTSTPPGVLAVSARPSAASWVDGDPAAGAPATDPSGKNTEVRRGLSFTERSAASNRERSWVTPPANTATLCASCRPAVRRLLVRYGLAMTSVMLVAFLVPLGQVVQQVELLWAQIERDAVQERRPGPGVDDDPADGDRTGHLGRLGATEHGADSRVELVRGERLDQVVVRAGVQQGDDLRSFVAGADHDHRDVTHRADHREQRCTVEVRQTEVEQHHVRAVLDEALQALHRRRGRHRRMLPGRERAHQGSPDGCVVLDDQHIGHNTDGRPSTARLASPAPRRTSVRLILQLP